MRCLQLVDRYGGPTRLTLGLVFVTVCGFVWGMDRVQPAGPLNGILTGVIPVLIIGSSLAVTLVLFGFSYCFDALYRREAKKYGAGQSDLHELASWFFIFGALAGAITAVCLVVSVANQIAG